MMKSTATRWAAGLMLWSASVLILMAGATVRSFRRAMRRSRPRPTVSGEKQQSSTANAVTAVAVLPFDNTMAREDLAALRRGFQEMLITDLAQSNGVRIVERARLDDLLTELKLAEGKFLDPSTAAKIGKGVGARQCS